MSKEPVCSRCGQCCWYERNGILVKCRHLRYNRRLARTYCAIYAKRRFMLANGENPVIDFYWNNKLQKRVTVICIYRKQMKRNYPGCPYNKKEYEGDENRNKS